MGSSSQWPHAHRDAVGDDGGDESGLLWRLFADWFQATGTQYIGSQHLDFDGGEVDADTQARSTAERDKAIRSTFVFLVAGMHNQPQHITEGKLSPSPAICDVAHSIDNYSLLHFTQE
jgi:hypothetical protein